MLAVVVRVKRASQAHDHWNQERTKNNDRNERLHFNFFNCACRWTHIAVTLHEAHGTLYVNGMTDLAHPASLLMGALRTHPAVPLRVGGIDERRCDMLAFVARRQERQQQQQQQQQRENITTESIGEKAEERRGDELRDATAQAFEASVARGETLPHYTGLVDDVSVWSRALSAAHVRRYMFERLYGDERSLEAYYTFNEAADNDNIARDFGPHAAHAHTCEYIYEIYMEKTRLQV